MPDSHILLMALSDSSGDPRPYRVIQLCNDIGLNISVASLRYKKDIPAINTFTIEEPSCKAVDRIYRKILGVLSLSLPTIKWLNILNAQRYGLNNLKEELLKQNFDLIVVEDLYLLPFAFEIKSNAKIIFDAREYYPEQLSDNFFWRWTERFNRIAVCRKYLPRCEAVLTVSPGLSEAYKENFGVDCHLIRSVPSYQAFVPKEPVEKIRMIHHGGALQNRKLENMIKLFEFLDDRFELDFCLVGDPAYINKLQKLAEPYPQIRFRQPVAFSGIGEMLSSYDIGLYLLEPTGFNVWRALPNKFFEFIQARLMLAIGPSPDMAALLHHYDCGLASDSFDPLNLAEKLNALTSDQVYAFKLNSQKAAEILCWEAESPKLVKIINDLLGRDKNHD